MKLLHLFCVLVLAGCANTVQPDGGADVVNDAVIDAANVDAPSDTLVVDAPPPDNGPVMCGTVTCTAAQFCMTRGGGAGISVSCVDIPAACGSGPLTCACLGAICPVDAHNRCTVSERAADCSCIDCP